ncbi:MAG: hypothetical protein WD271_06065 [Acidimicrobiia bacterium]
MLTLEINGQTSATVRQGDVASFEVLLDGGPAAEVLVDFEGSGAWEPAQGPVFCRGYQRAGRFVATVRCGDDTASARVRVTPVSVTGGAGLF